MRVVHIKFGSYGRRKEAGGSEELSRRDSKVKDTLRQLGYNKGTVRSPEDFYVTPEIAVIELLERETFEPQ